MTKIDCSITMNFLRERERMCNSPSCGSGCPVYKLAREDSIPCGYYLRKHPEFAIEIVQKWSDEHPTKTRLDDLLEKHPKMSLRENGLPNLSPAQLGYCDDCRNCLWCASMKECWSEPLFGGATGKAVE